MISINIIQNFDHTLSSYCKRNDNVEKEYQAYLSNADAL